MFSMKIGLKLKDDLPVVKIQNFLAVELKKAVGTLGADSLYCFGGLKPIEKDMLYKKDKEYYFLVRSLNIDILTIIRNNVEKIKATITECKVAKMKPIVVSELYTVTPVVVTIYKRLYWTTSETTTEDLKQRLENNLCKKLGITEHVSFIDVIVQKNDKPIKTTVTDFNYIGNKFSIKIKQDFESQKLANYALALGLGEHTKRGFGFCISSNVTKGEIR